MRRNDMAYTGYSEFNVEVKEGIGTLKFNRPEILNAVSPETMRQMSHLWPELDADPEVKAIILTGEGRKFSVGADYKAMESGPWQDPFAADTFAEATRRVRAQLDVRVPVIAAINGDVIGGGATIALMCDIILMEESARIGDPHVRAGAVAGDGGAVLWPLLCGPLLAKEFLMTGDLMSAERAERIGLVNRVVPDGTSYDEAVALARRFVTELPPVAVKWTKYSVNQLIRANMNVAFDLSLAFELLSFVTDDRKEAIAAFLEKRKGNFTGH
jgi:enoyl-CoA hydratase